MNTVNLAEAPPNKYRLASNIVMQDVKVAKAGMILDERVINNLLSLHVETVQVLDATISDNNILDVIDNTTLVALQAACKLQNVDNIKDSSRQLVALQKNSELLQAVVTQITNKCTSKEVLIDHCIGTAVIAGEIAIAAGFTLPDIQNIVAAGLVHDLGKCKIPDKILFAPRKLTPGEREVINKHATFGREMLQPYAWVTDEILKAVENHHENYDGTGYPHGIKEDEIGDYASVLHIADVYDALTRARAYKPSWTPENVIAYMKEQTGKMFNPKYIQALLDNVPVYGKNTFVRLSNGRLAVITRNTPKHMLQPVVLYTDDISSNITEVDLADTDIYIETAIMLP